MTTKRPIYYSCNLFEATYYTRLKIQIGTIDNKGLFFCPAYCLCFAFYRFVYIFNIYYNMTYVVYYHDKTF